MIRGIENEKINKPIEKNTLKDNNPAQSPEIQTSLRVPIRNVKIKVPTIIPRPVPAK
jgi:hypothetical protein